MSVLTKSDICKRLAKRDLVISPILHPKQIGPASVDLRLGNTALLVRGSDVSHVDPKAYLGDKRRSDISLEDPTAHLPDEDDSFDMESRRRRKMERISVPFHTHVMLHAGGVILVSTFEWVKIPKDLVGTVTARSSWAREGLSIATATFINPCYTGIITLELSNLGQIPIELYPGLRLAQIAFHELDPKTAEDCKDARGQFNDSFEPRAGRIVERDEAFIPTQEHPDVFEVAEDEDQDGDLKVPGNRESRL
jgi:dCTP deaminase